MRGVGRLPPPNFGCIYGGSVLRAPVFPGPPPSNILYPSSTSWLQPPAARPFYSPPASSHSGPVHWKRDNFSQGYRQHGKKKPEPMFTHFCDTCDRGFKNKAKYDEHVAQHVKCSVEDCSFTAHQKLVGIHWRNAHAPGKTRIKLDTPDEVAKWREERRKNYPTVCNVQKKQKLMEDQIERGEVLETARFGRMRGRGFRQRGKGRFHHHQGRWRPPASQDAVFGELKKSELQKSREGDPLGALVTSDADSDKDDAANGGKNELTVTLKNASSGLGALMANYGSTSESDQEPDDLPILRVSKALEENQAFLKNMCGQEQDAKSGHPAWKERPAAKPGSLGQQQWEHHASPSNVASANPRGRRKKSWRTHSLQKRKPTLLEMLLAPEIRHERNVILQCVRYIVQSSFFGWYLKDGSCSRGADPLVTAGENGQNTLNMPGSLQMSSGQLLMDGTGAQRTQVAQDRDFTTAADNKQNLIVELPFSEQKQKYNHLQAPTVCAVTVEQETSQLGHNSASLYVPVMDDAIQIQEEFNEVDGNSYSMVRKQTCQQFVDDEIWEASESAAAAETI